MNILMEYLYRDAGNNKVWGNVIFSNPLNIDAAVLHESIKNALIDGEFFVAEDVFLPVLRFSSLDDELDHGWHEYFSVKTTSALSNDALDRDISEFIRSLILSKTLNCH